MKRIFKVIVGVFLALVLIISGCSKKKATQTEQPISLTSLSPVQGQPGTMVTASTNLNSVSAQSMYIRLDTTNVPIISSGGSSFYFIIPIVHSGSTQVKLRLSDGRESNSLSFTVLPPQPTGVAPGVVIDGCAEAAEELLLSVRDLTSSLAQNGDIAPTETLSLFQDLARISLIFNGIKQQVATLPDSEKTAIDALLKQSGVSDLLGAVDSTGKSGMRGQVSNLRSALRAKDSYASFYCLVILDNISFALSAAKATITVVGIVAIISGVGAPAGITAMGLSIGISAADAIIEGLIPTDLYQVDAKFIPNEGPSMEVGKTAIGDFRGHFQTQSDPVSASIGFLTESAFSAFGDIVATTKTAKLTAEIATMVGVEASEELFKGDPLPPLHNIAVDIKYYDLSLLEIMDLSMPYMTYGFSFSNIEKMLSYSGVQIPALVTNPVQVKSQLATYDLSSNTLTAISSGTITPAEIEIDCWVMNEICELCLGVELPEPLKDTAYHTTGITIAVDNTPPAPITNLTAGNPTANSITLTWTAPGDDGNSGTASHYDIRYSTSTITEGNWNSASQCTGEPTPKVAGISESFTVTGLNSNTTYYLAIKTADEVPNWSGLSEIVSEKTLSDSTIYSEDFSSDPGWITNNSTHFYWDTLGLRYHYKIIDATQEYTYHPLNLLDRSFQLTYDALPTNTTWAGNFRCGVSDTNMSEYQATSVLVAFDVSSGGGHAISLIIVDNLGRRSNRVFPNSFSDNVTYKVTINYDAATQVVSFKAIQKATGDSVCAATIVGYGPFLGMNRIFMSSIGDNGYPGKYAEGYIDNVMVIVTNK